MRLDVEWQENNGNWTAWVFEHDTHNILTLAAGDSLEQSAGRAIAAAVREHVHKSIPRPKNKTGTLVESP